MIDLLNQINEVESEEFHKNIISKFLDKAYYAGNHYINTKGRNDLVIHAERTAKSPVAVIIETKKPTNKSEMIRKDNINTKAFQELILYYMRERIAGNNLEVKHLIITNIYEWYIFDVDIFEKSFAQNNIFEKKFVDFEEKRLSGKNTDFFYEEVAKPAIDDLINGNTKFGKDIVFTHFDIRDYEKILRNKDTKDDNKLIALYKLLSPEHLLKLPFKNDSNSLDKTFYAELLHIIGLEEIKVDGKKLIDRKKELKREEGAIIENTINQLDALGKIDRLDKPSSFGASSSERYFNVGLELVITWINRILFLKLLEAQLITYHKGDRKFSFLNNQLIKNYDDLNSLFFQVLAKPVSQRTASIMGIFPRVPYLNSSLFEPTEFEHNFLFISQLQDKREIDILTNTVLKDSLGKRRVGKLNALEYLLLFLDSYDFTSEGSEDIQEENKTLINASVLGLIFEKINGYKDGSFFTPGLITMYMCRESIRRVIINKFNQIKGWTCSSVDELYNNIDNKQEANEIINDIKICDPAVGSGHFLVSALNEIIALKSDLKILLDRNGRTLRDYHIEVTNDELTIADTEGNLFEYNPRNKESQRIQETLFHEKQTLIENCLFGVDINSNSVKICRLRLWIELLKNAYYKEDSGYTELETLPNIDINIKSGNSLISRFPLEVDLASALKKSKITIKSYMQAVQGYRHAENKEQKREIEHLISSIKNNFRLEISNNDPKVRRLASKRGELSNLQNQHSLFQLSKSEKKAQKLSIDTLNKEIHKLDIEIEEIKANKIYENAFEWRFEFPDVLDDDGNYVGFDVIVGNPPYIRIQDLRNSQSKVVEYYNSNYRSTGGGSYDLYIPFIELGYNLLSNKGEFCFIMPHKFTNANYGEKIREFIVERSFLRKLIHFGALQVFEDATTYTGLFFMSKTVNKSVDFYQCEDLSVLQNGKSINFQANLSSVLTKKEWTFLAGDESKLLIKLKQSYSDLESVTQRIFQGLKTSADKIYILEKLSEDTETYKVHCKQNKRDYVLEKSLLHPLIKGGNSRSYHMSETDLLILFPYSEGKLIDSKAMESRFPLAWSYLKDHQKYLEDRENGKMKTEGWYGYVYPKALGVMNQPKIFTPDIAPSSRFSFDKSGEFFFTGGVSGGYGIVPKDEVSPTYLLAILNSPIANWFISKTSTQMRGGWYSFEARYIKNIPIPPQPAHIEVLEGMVDELMAMKADKQRDYEQSLHDQINREIYRIYELSSEEIDIVERSLV
jgi:adenine-specific DNA-methyltransferase